MPHMLVGSDMMGARTEVGAGHAGEKDARKGALGRVVSEENPRGFLGERKADV